ncbi:unnamed protein product [Cylindrotheca closterium]|uniref:Peroxin-19 n=1 Tax=Cylindrotheca closterium TaxID=2856 RepID=A0AAD2JK16_9STRA|nr:unnamed protein product [Cylindrotheca closterium]
MDAVLDEALDELDDEGNSATSKSYRNQLDSKAGHNSTSKSKAMNEDIQQETAKKHNKKKNKGTGKKIDAKGKQRYQPQTVEEALGSLLEEMNRTSIEDIDQEDDFLREMLGLSDGGTENYDADAVIDGMMEQLLSKELMYEPMKQVLDQFPDYLDENQGNLSTEEYQQRCEQYNSFKRLIKVYEEEPSNTTKLMEQMQEVQKYGQPPIEIVQVIAPGLELDGEGIPAINPLMHIGTGDDDCCIM